MGANYYFPMIFFGITFPLKMLRAIDKAIESNQLVLPVGFKVCIIEHSTHSRSEDEDISDLLERCDGFIGVYGNFTLEELIEIKIVFMKFLEEKKEELAKYEIEGVPSLYAGAHHDLEYDYLDCIDGGEEDEDEHEDDKAE